MGATPIEWVRNAAGEQGHTINPIRFRNLETGKVGHHCEKVSPGCKNCYASTMNGGPYLCGLTYTAENTAKGEFFLDGNALEQVLHRRKPTAYFWCDMTDMFGRWVPDKWIDQCFATMALTPQHRHFVLTKRAERLPEYFADIPYRQEVVGILAEYESGIDRFRLRLGNPEDGKPRWTLPLPNVWLGVSVEDRDHLWRADVLRETPAAVRFLSVEPLLADLGEIHGLSGIDWVIVGGESGPGARPMDPAWPRSIRDQCTSAKVPLFFKQWGEWVGGSHDRNGWFYPQCGPAEGQPGSLKLIEWGGGVASDRVGKKTAGKLLDGREHSEYPAVRP